MSVEDFIQFSQKAEKDPEVRTKIKEMGLENVDGWIKYAKDELNLEFTKDDMQVVADNAGSVTEELTEEQLENIAGGFVSSTGAAVAGGVAAVAGAVAGGVSAGTAVADNVRRGW